MIQIAVLGVIFSLLSLAMAINGYAAELPQGAGEVLVRQQCGICHDIDLVVQQRLSREGWAGVLDDMTLFGAPFDAGQRQVILRYLATHLSVQDRFAAGKAMHRLPAAPGVEQVRFHCGICHNLDLVRVQRLSRDVWDEVLTDMSTYGAIFDDAQREIILDYLSAHLGP